MPVLYNSEFGKRNSELWVLAARQIYYLESGIIILFIPMNNSFVDYTAQIY